MFEDFEELFHNNIEGEFEIIKVLLDFLVLHWEELGFIESFHQAVVGLAFIQYGLENGKVLKLEEDPGGFDLLDNAFKENVSGLEEHGVLVVVFVLEHECILTYDVVVD